MVTKPEDGGAAFGALEIKDGVVTHAGGMTLRDYFAAKAPIEPWPFYEPKMPKKPDLGICKGKSGKKYIYPRDADFAEGNNWRFENQDAVDDWNEEKKRQYWIQWPWFYADAMLAERSK